MLPIVNTRRLPMPNNEAQLRELARVSDPKERGAVLVAAVEAVKDEGGNGKLTARAIQQAVEARAVEDTFIVTTPPSLTPGRRLVQAREKLDELEHALTEGEEPKRSLVALRRLLGE